ncbi:MAG TPA: S-methyl-5'-thioinosine phosphorylase [Marinagarivorans sp.]
MTQTDSSLGITDDAPAVTAIIGGSGFYHLDNLSDSETLSVSTPYGNVSGLQRGTVAGKPVVFMMRHGDGHKVPPHKINYRANIWALKSLGVSRIIAINAVGGIGDDCGPGVIALPDQLIDYSYGREHTFADVLSDEINHVEFGEPYSNSVRNALKAAAEAIGLAVLETGCYACTQGPRLETAAEIARLKCDGNTLVGMTAMPEAALARELAIEYGSVCIVANWGAGLSDQPITLEDIHAILAKAAGKVQGLVGALFR